MIGLCFYFFPSSFSSVIVIWDVIIITKLGRMERTFLSLLVYPGRGAWKKNWKLTPFLLRHYEKTLAKLGAKSDKLLKKPNRHAIAIRRVAVGFNLLLWLRIDILQLGKKQECSPPLVAPRSLEGFLDTEKAKLLYCMISVRATNKGLLVGTRENPRLLIGRRIPLANFPLQSPNCCSVFFPGFLFPWIAWGRHSGHFMKC